MSLLSTITKGKENRPPRLFVYGQEGVGKSLFSASAPAAFHASNVSRIRGSEFAIKSPSAFA